MLKKIAIFTIFLLLSVGFASAFEINELKTIEDYTDFDSNGYSNFTTNSDRYFLVEKIRSFDDDFKEEWFENNTSIEYTVIPMDDNIFSVADDTFEFYGYQEVVEIDGDYYMVSINQNSKLSPGEETLYLSDLQDFNKLNNLEPVEV